MSGTLFIMYGMLWGVNQGYLDADEYLPVIRRAWKAACDSVNAEGALGWVQPIADKPGHYSGEDTEAYGAGAYRTAQIRHWPGPSAEKDCNRHEPTGQVPSC